MTWALWKTGSPGIDFADLSAQHSDVLKRSQQSILILYGFPTSDLGSIEFRKCMEVFFFFQSSSKPQNGNEGKGETPLYWYGIGSTHTDSSTFFATLIHLRWHGNLGLETSKEILGIPESKKRYPLILYNRVTPKKNAFKGNDWHYRSGKFYCEMFGQKSASIFTRRPPFKANRILFKNQSKNNKLLLTTLF